MLEGSTLSSSSSLRGLGLGLLPLNRRWRWWRRTGKFDVGGLGGNELLLLLVVMLLLPAEEEEEEEEEVARLVALEAAAVAVEVESAAGDDGAFAEYRNFTASCTT